MLISNYNELDGVLRYLIGVFCSQDMNMQVNVTSNTPHALAIVGVRCITGLSAVKIML